MPKTKAEIQRDYAKRSNYAAQNKYAKNNTKHFGIILNINTDTDIIDWLSKQENKQGYIKSLIRKDMKNE